MRILRFVFVVVVATFQAQPAASEQEIRISHQWTEATDGRDRAARIFAQEVEAHAKGLKLRVYPNSSLNIDPTVILRALQSNSIEMAVYPLTYAATKIPEFSLAGLPGLVPDLKAAQTLKGTEIHAMLQSLAEAHGIRILTWWWAPGGLFARNREISGPTSVRGLKMRGGDPLFELMLREAGASVTNMPSTEIYPAMQAGALDAIGTTYEAFMSLRLSEQAKFATVGTSLFMGFCPLVISLTTWNRLTPDQKAAMEAASAISEAYFDSIERDLERQTVTTLRSAGVSIRSMSREDYIAWLELAQRTAWVEYTRTNPRSRKLLLKTIRTFLERLADKDILIDSIFGDDQKK